MSNLMLCPSCSRHLRLSEAACPFCGRALAPDERRPEPAVAVARGTSRGAAHAARVALLAGSAALACSSNTTPGDAAPQDSTQADSSSGSGGGGGMASATGGSGGGTGAGGSGTGGRLATPYGCVWPPDEAVEV